MTNIFRKIAAGALALTLVGCSSGTGTASNDDKTIRVGATPVPHAEILNDVVKDVLAKEGYTLEVTVFNDYVQPNTTVQEGDLDANYYQTLNYMEKTNRDSGYNLVAVAGVHIEPMGFYSSKLSSVSELQDGAVIFVPNDVDNEDRALRFLIAEGLLQDPGVDELTDRDFNGNAQTNPRNFQIKIAEAASLPRLLADGDLAVINGNYALEAELNKTNPALVVESFTDQQKIDRTNFIVVKDGSQDSEKIKALVKAINSAEVKQYIEDTYKGAVITSFIDPTTLNR